MTKDKEITRLRKAFKKFVDEVYTWPLGRMGTDEGIKASKILADTHKEYED